ncbi:MULTISPECIES: hypothetical protein [Sulfitobacter]|uniref:Uncharacterized protein n=1 Tax=Sulfitobacter profundi TaxID=2679961 RepID=A0ABW1YU65_9RHOB|nr:hypothetical protein [Sulfitobacter indolifex]
MDWNELMKVVGTFGGIASVSACVAAFVGKLISSRAIESHRAKLVLQLETHKSELNSVADRQRLLLKRQELMFEREYIAASEFYRLFTEVMPDAWAPDLDWGDAQVRIAENFNKHEAALKAFLISHSASLSQTVRHTVERAKQVATEGVFEVGHDTGGEGYEDNETPHENVQRLVDEFYELVKEANTQIRLDLESGSFSQNKNTASI